MKKAHLLIAIALGTIAVSASAQRVLTLLEPVGDEVYLAGDQTIHWQRTGPSWAPADTISIEYSDDAGAPASWTTLTTDVLAADDTFVWNVDGLSGPFYQMHLTCNEEPAATDTSGNFRIGYALGFYVNDADTTNDAYCTAAGDAANDGTTPGAPMLHIQDVVDTYTLIGGDTVYVDTGSYVLTENITVDPTDGGAELDPVIFLGSTHPDGSTIDRNDTGVSSAVAFDLNASYVRLDGLRVTGAYYGVRVNGAAGEIQACELFANRHGVYLLNSATVSDCLVHDNTDGGIYRESGQATIMGNSVQDNGGDGIYSYLSGAEAAICANIVQRNGGLGIYAESGAGASHTLMNNLVTANGAQGLDLRLGGSGPNISAANNTVVDNGSDAVCFYLYSGSGYAFTFKNNIVHTDGAGSVCFRVDSTLVGAVDYNTYYATNGACVGYHGGDTRPTIDQWRAATGQDAYSLAYDPLFVDPATGDYHLSSTAGSWHAGLFTADATSSRCIDAGAPGDSVGDETTPNGGRVNQGAYGGTTQASRTPTERIVTLLEPQGGEVYFSGGHTIRWQRTGTSWTGTETVHVEYSDDAGGTWETLEASLAVGDDVYPWYVDALPGGVFYQVRVTCNEDTAATDTSDDFRVGFGLMFYVNDGITTNDVYCTQPGSAFNDGVTPATPKNSIQDILDAYDIEGGDTVLIDTGNYPIAANITIDTGDSGTASDPVAFVGSSHPDGATIDRNDTSLWTQAIHINAPYVRLQSLRIRRGYNAVYGEAAGVEILDCELFENRYAVYLTDTTTIADCLVRDNISQGIYSTLLGASKQVTITGNTIQNNGDIGVSTRTRNGATHTLANNLVIGNGSHGLELRTWSGTSWVRCVNNTFAGNGSHSVYLQNNDGHIEFRNNIVHADGAGLVCFYVDDGFSSSSVLDYNTYYATNGAGIGYYGGAIQATLAEWRVSTEQDTASLDSDPLFVDPPGGDYHLSSTAGSWHDGAWQADPVSSPAIDAGDPADSVGEETFHNGGRINQGAYGGTEQASRTPFTLALDFGPNSAACPETLVVPIRIHFAVGVDVFGMTLLYNRDNLTYLDTSRGAACADWHTFSGTETAPGEVEIGGLAGAGTPVEGDGELVLVSFECNVCPSMSALTLTDLLYDVAMAEVSPGTATCGVAPTAAFEVDVAAGYTPLSVHFTDLSDPGSAPIATWEWDLDGDGPVDSYDQHPTYEYDVAGTYDVTLTVTTSVGSDTSEPLTIEVAAPLVFTGQPWPLLRPYVNDTAQFSVQYTGGLAPIDHQWWFDNGDKAPVPVGDDTSVLTIDPVRLEDGGGYWCDVIDRMDTYASNTAVLMVAPHLEILEHPEGATKPIGDTHTFTVVAQGGFAPLAYEWLKDEVSIPDATAPSYAIPSIGEADYGVYTAQVSDANSDVLTTDSAELTQCSGLPVAGIGALLALSVAVATAGACATRRRR